MRLFRFEIDTWDEDFGADNTKGFIAANDYGEAAKKLEAYCTNPKGQCSLIEMRLEEIDFTDEMLLDNDILVIRKIEDRNKKKEG